MSPVTRVRPASWDDILQLALLWVTTALHLKDPTAPFRFPNLERFTEAQKRIFKRLAFEKCFLYMVDAEVLVYETVDSNGTAKIVGMAVWQLVRLLSIRSSASSLPTKKVPPPSFLLTRPAPPTPEEKAQIASVAHCNAFKDKADLSKKAFDDLYPDGYMFLKVLYVAEGHQRQGIGSQLLLSALCKARRDLGRSMPAALFASACGHRLYERAGFSEVGRLIAEADGKELNIACMAIDAPGVEKLCCEAERREEAWWGGEDARSLLVEIQRSRLLADARYGGAEGGSKTVMS